MNGLIKKILQIKELLFSAVIIIATLLNLFITIKLIPITQNIAVLQSEVLANGVNIQRNTDYCKTTNSRLDKIYNLLLEFK
ncbi:MAG: hypothetical protein U9P50_01765 [Patescibacteria group bacterium]|nr:hypothetical protein [Patescibacteria group bacterium]